MKKVKEDCTTVKKIIQLYIIYSKFTKRTEFIPYFMHVPWQEEASLFSNYSTQFTSSSFMLTLCAPFIVSLQLFDSSYGVIV